MGKWNLYGREKRDERQGHTMAFNACLFVSIDIARGAGHFTAPRLLKFRIFFLLSFSRFPMIYIVEVRSSKCFWSVLFPLVLS